MPKTVCLLYVNVFLVVPKFAYVSKYLLCMSKIRDQRHCHRFLANLYARRGVLEIHGAVKASVYMATMWPFNYLS